MNSHATYGFLQGISANVQSERYSLTNSEVLIGRGTVCQIQLKDPKVSRQHARLRFNQGVVTIEDLNSAHGTLVNGVRVTSMQLTGGEELTLGDTLLNQLHLRRYPKLRLLKYRNPRSLNSCLKRQRHDDGYCSFSGSGSRLF
jgi:pSer/pThr/pTyr-binding forkhead associated (FHA) protein